MKLFKVKAGQEVYAYDTSTIGMVPHTMKSDMIFDHPAGDMVTEHNGTTCYSPVTIGGDLIKKGYSLFDTGHARYPFIAVPFGDVEVMC